MRKLRHQKRDNSASNRGQLAVAAILTAARDVIVEEGYPRLTMRNVANRARMTVGNLSYYYANKRDLMHDLVEAVLQGYFEDFETITDNVDLTPEERFGEMIRFIMSDLATKETTGFFPALWALANHDEFAAQEMNKIYQMERDSLAKVIGQLRPDLGGKERDLLALFMSASMEGHTMFTGYRREKASSLAEITNIALFSFLNLVKAIDARSIRELKPVSKSSGKRLAS